MALENGHQLTLMFNQYGYFINDFKRGYGTLRPRRLALQQIAFSRWNEKSVVQLLGGLNQMLPDEHGHVIVRTEDLNGNEIARMSWIEWVDGGPLVWNADSSAIVFAKQGKTIVARRPQYEVPFSEQLWGKIEKILESDDLSQLEGVVDYLRSHEISSTMHYPDEAYSQFIEFLAENMAFLRWEEGGDLHERMDRRLQHYLRRRPHSMLIKSVLAKHRIIRAWVARGGGWADTVTESGFQEFNKQIDAALEVMRKDIAFKDMTASSYISLLSIGRAKNWRRDRFQKIIDKMMEGRSRDSIPAHLVMLESLATKWGGSANDCLEYQKMVGTKLSEDRRAEFYMLSTSQILINELSRNPTLINDVDWTEFEVGLRDHYRHSRDPSALDHAYMIARDIGKFDLAKNVAQLRCDLMIPEGFYPGGQMSMELRHRSTNRSGSRP